MPFEKALKLAESWISVVAGDDAILDTRSIKTLPYGWIFPWNSREYLADPARPFEKCLIGNNPIFIDRVNAELLVAGPAGIDWVGKYEGTLPLARLQLKPEFPVLESHGDVSAPNQTVTDIDGLTGIPREA